jgi:DNA-binding Lrp family transcriptional regulator
VKFDDEKNQQIIKFLQGDIPLQSHPLKNLAADLQLPEEEVLERIKDFQARGIMRRWGAVLRHQKAG